MKSFDFFFFKYSQIEPKVMSRVQTHWSKFNHSNRFFAHLKSCKIIKDTVFAKIWTSVISKRRIQLKKKEKKVHLYNPIMFYMFISQKLLNWYDFKWCTYFGLCMYVSGWVEIFNNVQMIAFGQFKHIHKPMRVQSESLTHIWVKKESNEHDNDIKKRKRGETEESSMNACEHLCFCKSSHWGHIT